MKNTIKEFIEPTNKEKQELWQKAVFVFDTNVLLNLYRYSAKTRKSLLAAFENFKDRVWIPYQVAYEYMRKRCEVIYETVQRYEQFKKEMQNFTNNAIETLRLTSRACLKNHSRDLHSPLCGEFIPNLVNIAHYDS